jgi:TorA maturation chaperone TorD
MNNLSLAEQKMSLMGEILLCSLLGKILFGELDKAWLENLISEDVFAEAPFGAEQAETQHGIELLQHWTKDNQTGISEEEFKILKRDHLRLFIGTDRVLAPVWESVYCNDERLVFQEETLQVRQWFSRFGLQSELLYREPDDHIGLELSFIAHLASLALKAIESEDQQTLDETVQAQRDFLHEHLLRWGPVWTKLVVQHAETDFYKGVAHLTYGTLLAVAEFLKIELPEEKML